MFDKLSFFKKIGIFLVPIILVIGGIYGPKSLRNVCWGMLVFILGIYLFRLF